MSTKWITAGCVAILIRIVLFYFHFDEPLGKMVELVTPTTNFRRLTEGIHLVTELNLSPYSSSSLIQPPLVLLPFLIPKFIGKNALFEIIWNRAVFIIVDCILAYVLFRIAKKALSSNLLLEKKHKKKEETQTELSAMDREFLPHLMAGIYLFNPIIIASCVAMSTVSFNTLCIAACVLFALQENVIMSTLFVALASYLSIYPIVLLIPVIMIIYQIGKQRKSIKSIILKGVVWFIVWIGMLLYLSYSMTGSWEFMENVYLYILKVEDLTPNWGNFWYFFTEVFDHFRLFFMCIFHVHILVLLVPLTIRFRENGLCLAVILIAVISVFKPYPTLADTSFYLTMLLLYVHLFPNIRYGYFLAMLMVFCISLGPVFFDSWIYKGTGNANFFYFLTLGFLLGQVGLMVETSRVFLKELRDHKKVKQQ